MVHLSHDEKQDRLGIGDRGQDIRLQMVLNGRKLRIERNELPPLGEEIDDRRLRVPLDYRGQFVQGDTVKKSGLRKDGIVGVDILEGSSRSEEMTKGILLVIELLQRGRSSMQDVLSGLLTPGSELLVPWPSEIVHFLPPWEVLNARRGSIPPCRGVQRGSCHHAVPGEEGLFR